MKRVLKAAILLSFIVTGCSNRNSNSVKPIPYLNNDQKWDNSIVVLGDWDGDPETPYTYLHWAPVNVGFDASGEIATRDDHRSGRLYQWGAEDDDTNVLAKMRYYNESKQQFWYTGMELEVYYHGNKWKDNQGPCPKGWRLPTTQEMSCLFSRKNGTNGWTSSGNYAGGNSYAGAEFFGLNDDLTPGKGVFFPATGYIDGKYGSASRYGEIGGYWTSDAVEINAGPAGNYSRAQANVLKISPNDCSIQQSSHSYGYAVRCVHDDANSLTNKPSSKSTTDYLKDATDKYNEFAEGMGNAKHQVEFDQYVAEYSKYLKSIPKSILEMPDDQLACLDGGREYLEALENLDQVYKAKSRFFLFGNDSEPKGQNEPSVAPEQESDARMNESTSGHNAKDYFLEPGVTYITESSGAGTDEFEGKVSLSMEFTIYKDGTARGNLIETNSTSSYGNNNSYEHPVEGTWKEVSKHDRPYLQIVFVLESDDYYNEFTYYIDENLNAYANDINTRPVRLRMK